MRRSAHRHTAACLLLFVAAIFVVVVMCPAYDGHDGLVHAAGTADAAATEATTDQPPTDQPQSDSPQGIWEILRASGLIGLLIILLSLAAVALVVEHLMTIRRAVLMPPDLADEVARLVADGQLAPARQQCRAQPSFLAFVLDAGLAETDGGWPAMEKAMEDAAADQSARLFRKIEYLSVIGNIAPMLGLLGTVVGMIFAFREVADTQGAARAADLAGGIYLALVTTVEGLLVAIPSLGAFAVFRNRVDQLVAEAAYVAQHVFAPLKRRRPAAAFAGYAGTSPPAPPPAGGR